MQLRRLAMGIVTAAMCAIPAMGWSMPILNAGWATTDSDGSGYTDHIDDVLPSLNVGGAYVYALGGPAIFRLTDVLVLGDVWTVYDFGVPILTTVVASFASGFGDNAEADSDWTDAVHTKGQILLAAGAHSLTISGNGVGGLPAHYFARLDAVPEPTTLSLIALALAAFAVARPRRTH